MQFSSESIVVKNELPQPISTKRQQCPRTSFWDFLLFHFVATEESNCDCDDWHWSDWLSDVSFIRKKNPIQLVYKSLVCDDKRLDWRKRQQISPDDRRFPYPNSYAETTIKRNYANRLSNAPFGIFRCEFPLFTYFYFQKRPRPDIFLRVRRLHATRRR